MYSTLLQDLGGTLHSVGATNNSIDPVYLLIAALHSIHQALLNRTHNVSNILPVVGRSQAKRKIRPNALLQHLRTCFALSKARGFVR